MERERFDPGHAIGETIAAEIVRVHLDTPRGADTIASVLESASWVAAAMSVRASATALSIAAPKAIPMTAQQRKAAVLVDLDALSSTPPAPVTTRESAVCEPWELELGLDRDVVQTLAGSGRRADEQILRALSLRRAAHFHADGLQRALRASARISLDLPASPTMHLAAHAKVGPLFWLRDYAVSFASRHGSAAGIDPVEWLDGRLAAAIETVRGRVVTIPDSAASLEVLRQEGLVEGLLPQEISRPALARDALSDLAMFEQIVADATLIAGITRAPQSAPHCVSP